MDSRNESFADEEDKRVDEEDDLPPRLPRTWNSMNLHRLSRLDKLYFTETSASTTPDVISSRSASSSDEAIFIHGRTKQGRGVNDKKLSGAFGRLSLSENGEKSEESRDDVSPHASATPSTSQADEQCSYDSGHLIHLVAKGLRPPPSQISAAERDNPYRDVDLNGGWNRAAFQGVKQYIGWKPSISNSKITQDFAGFSLKARQVLVPVHSDLEKYFTFVFKRTGAVNKPFHTCHSLVLTRCTLPPINTINLPPTWFHPHLHNLSDFSAKILGKEVFVFDLPPEAVNHFCKLVCQLVPFRGERKRSFNVASPTTAKVFVSEKRQCLHLGGKHTFQQNPDLKLRAKRNRLVVDDGWRMRMRRRAVNGGRWTDGTVRQNKLWAGFHWVLDGEVEEDPLEQMRAFVDLEN